MHDECKKVQHGAVGDVGGRAAEVLTGTAVDGRTARAARTRRLVVEAMIELVEQGDLEPTAQEVADRAGVSLRTVFHHFQSMELVFAECWEVQVERHWSHLAAVPADGHLAHRIDATVHQRAELFEGIAGPRRAAAVWAHRSEVLALGLQRSRASLRGLLAETFAPELGGDPQPEVLLDALDVATCFEAWDVLRHGGERPVAVAAVTRSLHALLAPDQPPTTDPIATAVQEDDRP